MRSKYISRLHTAKCITGIVYNDITFTDKVYK